MVHVYKFGGSSLSTPEKILQVAKKISLLYQKHTDIQFIIVVSAMGTTTNALIDLGNQVHPEASSREKDLLVSAGERISMALMSMALEKYGCPSKSFTGSQAGILTTPDYSNARIQKLTPWRIEKALETDRIAVVAGYQGVCKQTLDVTTLGRGGTDTTAIALASHFQASKCILFKDVKGVFSHPPHTSRDAQSVPHIKTSSLHQMSLLGCPVVHSRATEYALNKNVKFEIAYTEDFKTYSFIDENGSDPNFDMHCRLDNVGIHTEAPEQLQEGILVTEISGAKTWVEKSPSPELKKIFYIESLLNFEKSETKIKIFQTQNILQSEFFAQKIESLT